MCLHNKNNKENEMESKKCISNLQLYYPVTMDDVESLVCKLGYDKATGMDSIPNLYWEMTMSCKYYIIYFVNYLMWLKSVINPIPKDLIKTYLYH